MEALRSIGFLLALALLINGAPAWVMQPERKIKPPLRYKLLNHIFLKKMRTLNHSCSQKLSSKKKFKTLTVEQLVLFLQGINLSSVIDKFTEEELKVIHLYSVINKITKEKLNGNDFLFTVFDAVSSNNTSMQSLNLLQKDIKMKVEEIYYVHRMMNFFFDNFKIIKN